MIRSRDDRTCYCCDAKPTTDLNGVPICAEHERYFKRHRQGRKERR